MPNHKSAEKRVITNEKARLRNRHYRSTMRTAIKKLRTTKDKESAEKQYRDVTSLLDRFVLKRIVNKNQAARQKSRLYKVIASLS